jgi:hypothetical protein
MSEPWRRRGIVAFIRNNPFAWHIPVGCVGTGFDSYDIAERFGCSESLVRMIRLAMRRAGQIPSPGDAP